MSKYWRVNAESVEYCGVSHTFCVKAPDHFTEEMIEEYLPLIVRGEEAMIEYLDEDDQENEDAMLCTLEDIHEWDYDNPETQTWAEHFEIIEE
jgi:hypothetical protein